MLSFVRVKWAEVVSLNEILFRFRLIGWKIEMLRFNWIHCRWLSMDVKLCTIYKWYLFVNK